MVAGAIVGFAHVVDQEENMGAAHQHDMDP